MLRVAEAVHRTDTGRQREANEDSYFARAPVFAVADGMGGARAGEVASRIAVEAFDPERDSMAASESYLRETAQRANREIFRRAQSDTERSGMGTTLTAAMLDGDDVSFGHVGDSRAYLWRDGQLSQLTNDHSLVEELRRQGKLTRDQAAEHPQRSVITRALGPEPEVAVDTLTVRARDDDVFVLCSDGLTTMLDDDDLAAILVHHASDLDEAARALVRAANEGGGRDNITVVLFRLEDAGGAAPDAEAATLVGSTAEEAGLTAAAVREGATASPSRSVTEERPAAVPSGRGKTPNRWRGRLAKVLAVVLLIGLLAGAAVYGARQVYFLGADEGGRVTLYRGLPYELPLDLKLYSENFSSPVTVAALPEERQGVATDHELRSRDDAISLLEDLQAAATEQAQGAAAQGAPGGAASGGGSGSGGGAGGNGG